MQQERRAFHRRQFLQSHEQGDRDGLVQFRLYARVGSGVFKKGLREPFADIDFPLRASGLQLV